MKTIQVKSFLEIPSGFTGVAEYLDGSKFWYLEGKLHREEGPAVERSDGRKDWYKEGKRHREDGPAIECADGSKYWYLNGLPHREDGPAIEWADGTKEWYKEGKLHREDGPACEWADGTKRWYLDGKMLSSETEWKAEREKRNMKTIQVKDSSEIPPGFTGIAEFPEGTKRWFKEGKYHREDGPAYERSDGMKRWFLDGTRFFSETEWKAEREKRNMKTIQVKDSSEIPAGFTGVAEYADGTKEWFKEGKYHREDGPAIERYDGTKAWYKEGKYHREDGPAVEWADGEKHWYKEGELHREDGPAVEHPDGRKEWYKDGKLHREDGPAIERSDGMKRWYLDGKMFSSETEWKAEREKRSLKTIQVKSFFEIPAGFTGIVEHVDGTKVWYKEGKYHREDGPAVEFADGTKEWYKEGKLHREDGPAVEGSDGTKVWFEDGTRINLNVEIDAKKLNDGVQELMEEKMISQKNNTSQIKTESSLKSDGKKMAKRAGARKIINLMTGFLVGILSMGKTKKQTSVMKTAIADWLKTDQGTIVLGWLLGTLLPMFLEHLPEKYHAIAREMAEEFRVEAGSKALEIAMDFLTGPMFSGTKTALMTVFDSVMNAEEPSGIRAVLDSKGTESTEVVSSFSKEASNQTSA